MKRNKRIGIITFQNVPNYGAVLQASTLRLFIKSLGYKNVRILECSSKGNDDSFETEKIKQRIRLGKNPIKVILKQIIWLINSYKYDIKLKKFNDFREEYMNLDYSPESLNNNYDVLLYGSDQIWNTQITEGFNDFYFARNITNPQILKASVAASCGDVNVINSNDMFIRYIREFDYLSVRESSLDKYIRSKGLDCVTILDPTFLFSEAEYRAKYNIKHSENKYILIYELQPDKVLIKAAKKIADEKGWKIKHICGYINQTSINVRGCFDAGPKDFLEMIANATCVLTNSFHGVAFAIIFRRNFYVNLPNNRKSRITDLLESMELSARVVSEFKYIKYSEIDYEHIEKKLKDNIANTKRFIHMVLEKEKN